MAKQLFANNVSVTINEELTATDTTITVSSAAAFPTISGGDWIMGTIVPQGGQGSREVVKITAISGNNLTVVRGQEGTAGQSFLFGSLLELRVTKGSLEFLRDHPGIINVKIDNGAIGDGVADDTAALQAAIDQATAGDEIYFPRGTYKITSQINLNKKLKLRGAVSGEGGSIAATVGSKISGSGHVLVKMTEACVVEGLAIVDPTGNVSTVALEITDGTNAVVNWVLRDVFLSNIGATSFLGTGLRLRFALKGVIENCVIEGWNVGASFEAVGADVSNAVNISGSKVRINTVGLDFVSIDDVFLFGNTIEGNFTGIRQQAGSTFIYGNHFENNQGGTPTNFQLTAGNYHGFGNFYGAASANRDIIISGGGGRHFSVSETINSGVTHNGTGTFLIEQTTNGGTSIAGTGRVIVSQGDGFIGTNASDTTFSITGYGAINMGQPILRAGTQVVDIRRTGWSAASGTATRTSFDTATVTTTQLAERVKALLDDLIAHGLIGT